MKVRVQISNSVNVEAEGDNTKDIFSQLSMLTETFGDAKCGACGKSLVRFVVRKQQEYEFFEQQCLNPDCRARLSFGADKLAPGRLYPKRLKTDAKGKAVRGDDEKVIPLPNRGWQVYQPD